MSQLFKSSVQQADCFGSCRLFFRTQLPAAALDDAHAKKRLHRFLRIARHPAAIGKSVQRVSRARLQADAMRLHGAIKQRHHFLPRHRGGRAERHSIACRYAELARGGKGSRIISGGIHILEAGVGGNRLPLEQAGEHKDKIGPLHLRGRPEAAGAGAGDDAARGERIQRLLRPAQMPRIREGGRREIRNERA